MKNFILLPLLMIGTIALGQTKNNTMDNSTVKSLELERYLGKWYEIARFPHSFEKGLVGVTATYSLREDGKIKVLNQGYKSTLDGKLKTAIGKAYIPDMNDLGKLRVSFFLFFYGDYFILELDPDYQWVLIGSSSDKYLWILSRTAQLEKTRLEELIRFAKNRGYNTNQLLMVPQK